MKLSGSIGCCRLLVGHRWCMVSVLKASVVRLETCYRRLTPRPCRSSCSPIFISITTCADKLRSYPPYVHFRSHLPCRQDLVCNFYLFVAARLDMLPSVQVVYIMACPGPSVTAVGLALHVTHPCSIGNALPSMHTEVWMLIDTVPRMFLLQSQTEELQSTMKELKQLVESFRKEATRGRHAAPMEAEADQSEIHFCAFVLPSPRLVRTVPTIV